MGILNSGLPGGGEFAHQKISQWFKPGGGSSLELTGTLMHVRYNYLVKTLEFSFRTDISNFDN